MVTRELRPASNDAGWQEFRQSLKTIGGSDAGTLLGLNKYASPYSLWAEKTGKVVPADISDKEAVRLGNDLEDYVASRFEEATGKKVRRTNYVYRNTEYPFAHANLDRVVVGENGAGLECKTTSSWEILKDCREGRYPDTWYVQMCHYMMVTGADHWYLGVLCLGHGFFVFDVQRDDAEINALSAAESNFYAGITNDIPPAIDGTEASTDALKTILGESEEIKVDLTPMYGDLASLDALNVKIKELQEEADGCKNRIMQFMGSAGLGNYDKYSVSFKTSSRKTFDRKAWEKDHGAIPDEYFKTSNVRSFRLTVRKEQ